MSLRQKIANVMVAGGMVHLGRLFGAVGEPEPSVESVYEEQDKANLQLDAEEGRQQPAEKPIEETWPEWRVTKK